MYHQLNAYSPKQLSFSCHGTLFSKKQPLTFELNVLKRKTYDLENDDLGIENEVDLKAKFIML